MNYGALAAEYFRKGYNCSQAVLLAFSDKTGLDEVTAAKLASGFGGGIGRLREVCGAFSGAVMVLGMLYGEDTSLSREKKAELYTKIQDFAEKCRAENGSYLCRELLSGIGADSSPIPAKRTEAYYRKRPCEELVRITAELLEDFVSE